MEFVENVGYTVLGGGIAAVSGLVVQRWHTRWERKNNIKKIRGLLKPEFERIYQLLIDERRTVERIKLRSEEDFDSLSNHTMMASEYLDIVGSRRLHSLVWDAIISSGNLIKLDNDEIKITQLAQQIVRNYNENMDNLQNIVGLQLKNQFSKNPIPNVFNMPDVGVLHYYLDKYKQMLDEAINRFKELDKLPWFDHDKIKSAAPNRGA